MAKKPTKKNAKGAPEKGAPQPDKGKKKISLEARMKAKYGDGVIMRGDQKRGTERVSWGSFGLDYISGGGIVIGRIVEIFGDESAGKTTICLLAAQEFIKEDREVWWIDIDNSWDDCTSLWARALGVDASKIRVMRPTSGEDAMNMARVIVEAGTNALVVIDSWANVTCSKEIEAAAGDKMVGVNATLCNQAIRQVQTALNLPKTKTAILITNQTRPIIGSPTPATTTPGGRALKFAAAMRLKVRRVQWQAQTVRGEKITVGQDMAVKSVKNKTFPPYKETQPLLYVMSNKYGSAGWDIPREMIRYGMLWSLVKDLPADKKLGAEAGYHYVDGNGEWRRLGKDENQAVFQLNKPVNAELRVEFERIMRAEAKHRMDSAKGITQDEPEDETEDDGPEAIDGAA